MKVGEGACRKEGRGGGGQQGLHLRERWPGTFKNFEKWSNALPPISTPLPHPPAPPRRLWKKLKKGILTTRCKKTLKQCDACMPACLPAWLDAADEARNQ